MINKKLFLLILCTCIIVVSVLYQINKKTQIHKLKNISISENKNENLYEYEYFVVSNPPIRKNKLLKIIKKFNDSILISDLSKNCNIYRRQSFYRENGNLNKDFEEKNPNLSGYFEKVDIAHYSDSKIFESSWHITDNIAGHYTSFMDSVTGNTTHFFYPDRAIAIEQINNINSVQFK